MRDSRPAINQMTADHADFHAWTPAERESFFAAIARHRRAARRIAWLSNACAGVLALVVAILMSPLFYALLGLLLDIVNWLVPMPDLFKAVMAGIDPLLEAPASVPLWRWLYVAVLAALPGVVVMGVVMLALSRVMREATLSDAGNFKVRAPDPRVLAEQRFANVVNEMAVAASLAQPRVFIIDSEAANAAAFGEDGGHATLVMSTGMLGTLNRDEMQGVAAHLVGSIANGDLAVGTQVATTLGLFGVVSKLSGVMADRAGTLQFLKLVRQSLRKGSTREDGELALQLTDPFGSSSTTKPAADPAPGSDPNKVDWRIVMWLPLMGPLLITGFFGGMLATLALSPLLAWAWRRRKLLADATAVRLTRDPDTLAAALNKIARMPTAGAFAPWSAHMSVAHVELIGGKGMFRASGAKMFPSSQRRLKALAGMGASIEVPVERSRWRSLPLGLKCVLVLLFALVAGLSALVLYLLVFVSVAMSGLFTWVPAIILHALLR